MAPRSPTSTGRAARRIAPLFALVLVAAACGPAPAATPAGQEDMILATTTSTQDSGLLDVLVPAFEEATGYNVKTVAVGSGQAMALGRECNADVLLVHSPAAEAEFMDAGSGVDRRRVMHNDFVVVGPPDDPAGIRGTAAAEALAKIAATAATFVSRADQSGTNAKELAIWDAANISPTGAWYLESGQGMAATLTITSEKGGYTLTDRATYLSNRDNLALDILVEGDAALFNVYHVISVNPEPCPQVNAAGATAFTDYLISAEAQAIIGAFGTEEFGQPLFVPNPRPSEE